MKKINLVILPLICAALFFSCATTVKATIERPAELDLNGAEELSVIPFQSNADSVSRGIDVTVSIIDLFASIATGRDYAHGKYSDQIEIADQLTHDVTNQFAGSNYIKLVNSSSVEAALRNGTAIPCDVYLTGHISDFQNEIRRKRETVYVEKTVYEHKKPVTKKVKEYKIRFYREISFDVSYQIIDAETNRITASRTHHVYECTSNYDRSNYVPSAVDTVKYDLQSIASTIMRQIQPHYITKTYQLTRDKTKNEQMKAANKLAKNGQIKEAQQLFDSLYKSFHYSEALYNSAVLLAAMQNYTEAKAQLDELISISPTPEAYTALADVNNEIKSLERLNRQKNEQGARRRSPAKKVPHQEAKPEQPSRPRAEPKQDAEPPKPSKKGVFTSDKYDDIEGI